MLCVVRHSVWLIHGMEKRQWKISEYTDGDGCFKNCTVSIEKRKEKCSFVKRVKKSNASFLRALQ